MVDVSSLSFHALFAMKLGCLLAGFNSQAMLGWWHGCDEINQALMIGRVISCVCMRVLTSLMEFGIWLSGCMRLLISRREREL